MFSDDFKNKSLYSKKKAIAIELLHFISAGKTLERYETEFTLVSKLSYKIFKRYNDTHRVNKDLKNDFPFKTIYLNSIAGQSEGMTYSVCFNEYNKDLRN